VLRTLESQAPLKECSYG